MRSYHRGIRKRVSLALSTTIWPGSHICGVVCGIQRVLDRRLGARSLWGSAQFPCRIFPGLVLRACHVSQRNRSPIIISLGGWIFSRTNHLSYCGDHGHRGYQETDSGNAARVRRFTWPGYEKRLIPWPKQVRWRSGCLPKTTGCQQQWLAFFRVAGNVFQYLHDLRRGLRPRHCRSVHLLERMDDVFIV